MTVPTIISSKRIDSIDVAKEIGIMLVVLFHTQLEYFTTVRDMQPAIIFTLIITIISYFSGRKDSFINLKDGLPYALCFLPVLYLCSHSLY